MKKPYLKMFKLTKEEQYAVYQHFTFVNDCPAFYFPLTSKYYNSFDNHVFCETLFIGFKHFGLSGCPCFEYGNQFGTDALITLLDWNGFEFPIRFNKDCNPIQEERTLPRAIREFI